MVFGCVFSRRSFFYFGHISCLNLRSRLGAGAFCLFPMLNFQIAIFGSVFFSALWLRQFRFEIMLSQQHRRDFLGCNPTN